MIANVMLVCRQLKHKEMTYIDPVKKAKATTYAEKQILDTLSRVPKIKVEI